MNYAIELSERYPTLAPLTEKLVGAVEQIKKCYKGGGTVYVAGNGGSSADAEHISGELLKGFMLKRTPTGEEYERLSCALGEDAGLLQGGVPCIPLTALSAAMTAFCNDVEPSLVFAQLVYVLAKPGDILICISTSGNSENVVKAAKAAKALGINTISLTGEGGGELSSVCDLSLSVPEKETYRVQELHLPIYHALCAQVEWDLFGNG